MIKRLLDVYVSQYEIQESELDFASKVVSSGQSIYIKPVLSYLLLDIGCW